MKVSIWDLDYFHAEEKVNCFNPDVMKISSYHKQLGDTINFVTTVDDIRRPYDLYYIIKEKDSTPNPPLDFFTNKKVKWWGDAYRARVKWKMSDAMLGCRPDYLLYPEYNTQLERSEHVRFFNNRAELLPIIQDYTNTFKRKKLIVTDKYLWYAKEEDILKVLKELKTCSNLYFMYPIHLSRLLLSEKLRNEFFQLRFSPGMNLNWLKIPHNQFDAAIEFISELRKLNPKTQINVLTIDYSENKVKHWKDKSVALEDFMQLKSFILKGKQNNIKVKIKMPQLFETPYAYLFSVISEWSYSSRFRKSWLNYITWKFNGISGDSARIYWNHPERWNEVFRDLLRQTYQDKDFLLHEWGSKSYSFNEIPWKLWEEEFKYGI